ncbi:M48 family peptidase [Putridiphycobacter roseus]|uniref:M48 family peptidase n=1 Tax=Putridiphycobacter roseus TaxID=2219161 RepID=A0A2W1NH76_9FLAO|nr:M48 family metallopeptidase [Putridiphycobacter roseus]PZE18453.1 M48 family peptidase [Putridiphycobacter roseus]
MNAELIKYSIIGFILLEFIFNKYLSYLNNKHWSQEVPKEMQNVLDEKKYAEAAAYHKVNGKFGLISSVISFLLIVSALFFGWFGLLDEYSKTLSDNLYLQSGFFFLILYLLSLLIAIPFSYYETFYIEASFGFNKTSKTTFWLDQFKSLLLTLVIGGGLIFMLVFFYHYVSTGFWYWLWLIMVLIVILTNMFYADFILPIFNKLSPLPPGELKTSIQTYANKVGYEIKNIYSIDGSKRSTKANAFFSGLGPRKTIALYDTLIDKNTTEELTAILAHEIGHYKKKHVYLTLLLSIVQLGITFFLLEYSLSFDAVAMALGGEEQSLVLGLVAFGFIFSPVGFILGILMNFISRKNEFEADAYAKETYGGKPLIEGLKKLSVDSLSNLYPHPLNVFINYSHPPLLERIKAIKQ